jgi:hypothetical protein
MVAPIVLAIGIAAAFPDAGTDPFTWLFLVVGIDVAHTWSSLWRTWLDPAERRRRPALYTMLPLGALAASVLAWSLGVFWTVLAYIALWHFVRQAVGITALYQRASGVTGWEARIERALVYGVTLAPVTWWHTRLPQRFHWFLDGDFRPLPDWAWPAAAAATGLVALVHLGARLRSRRWTPGRDLWLASTSAAWWIGILAGGDLAFTVTNVVAHGIPYVVLTRRTESVHAPLWVFLALPVLLALAEEGAWDHLVWHENAWLFGDEGIDLSWATPLLAVPQVTHYLVDGFIWRSRDYPAVRALGRT